MDFLQLLESISLEDHEELASVEELISTKINMYLLVSLPYKKNEKNNDTSKSYKQDGDKYLDQCLFQDAVQEYTKALEYALPKSEIVPDCYHQRAMALMRMKEYKDSSLDIERALQSPLTDEKKNALIEMQKKLANLVSKHKETKKKPLHNTRTGDDVTLSYGESEEVPGASSAISISYTKEFGRFFVATKPIAAGDVLLAQEPYMLIVTKEKELCFCNYCLKPTMALIPCDSCVGAFYCSIECRAKAYDKYHRIECKVSAYQNDITCYLRLFLLVTNQGKDLRKVLTYLKQKKKVTGSRTAGFTNNQFNGKSAEAVLSLVNHMDQSINLMRTSTAALITVSLKKDTNILDGHDLDEVGYLIFWLTCTFTMNTVMIRDKHLNDINARAIYPVFNLLNHSCVTNTLWYSSTNQTRILLASRDIKVGEQIYNNYLGECILADNVQQRMAYLSTCKQFKCCCEACSKGYNFKRELRRLKVPIRVQRQLRKNPLDIGGMWAVLKCMYNETSSPCADIELMKFAIMLAYMGRQHPTLLALYRALGIL